MVSELYGLAQSLVAEYGLVKQSYNGPAQLSDGHLTLPPLSEVFHRHCRLLQVHMTVLQSVLFDHT